MFIDGILKKRIIVKKIDLLNLGANIRNVFMRITRKANV